MHGSQRGSVRGSARRAASAADVAERQQNVAAAGWSVLPTGQQVPRAPTSGRTWGGGGGTCHECRKSNATKGALYQSSQCQAQLRGGRRHCYHLSCLEREYLGLFEAGVCPACAGACVCFGGRDAHRCKVSMRPGGTTAAGRRRQVKPVAPPAVKQPSHHAGAAKPVKASTPPPIAANLRRSSRASAAAPRRYGYESPHEDEDGDGGEVERPYNEDDYDDDMAGCEEEEEYSEDASEGEALGALHLLAHAVASPGSGPAQGRGVGQAGDAQAAPPSSSGRGHGGARRHVHRSAMPAAADYGGDGAGRMHYEASTAQHREPPAAAAMQQAVAALQAQLAPPIRVQLPTVAEEDDHMNLLTPTLLQILNEIAPNAMIELCVREVLPAEGDTSYLNEQPARVARRSWTLVSPSADALFAGMEAPPSRMPGPPMPRRSWTLMAPSPVEEAPQQSSEAPWEGCAVVEAVVEAAPEGAAEAPLAEVEMEVEAQAQAYVPEPLLPLPLQLPPPPHEDDAAVQAAQAVALSIVQQLEAAVGLLA